MRNIYLVILILSVAIGSVWAQHNPLAIPAANSPVHFFLGTLEQDGSVLVTGASNSIVHDIGSRQQVVWEEDFAGAINQSNEIVATSGVWTKSGTHGDVWKFSTTGSNGCFSGNSPLPQVPSANNGFLIFDADSVNCVTPGQTPVYNQNSLSGSVVSPIIDLSGNPAVVLSFAYQTRWCCSDQSLLVEVSSDGGLTWTESFEVLSPNANDALSNIFEANVSQVLGGSSQARFRFTWEMPSHYYWAVDDISISEPENENDIVFNELFYGNVNFIAEEYAITPSVQQKEVELGVSVTNFGRAKQSNVTCQYDFLLDGTSVEAGSFLISDTLYSGQISDTVWFETGFIPSDIGLYTVNCTVVADSTDEVPSNNDGSRMFETSEFEWSHEMESLWSASQYGGYIVANTSPVDHYAYAHGTIFTIQETANLFALRAYFGASTTASQSAPLALTVEVHELGSSVQDIVETWEYPVDIDGKGWRMLVLEDPITLNQGSTYVLAIRTEGGQDVITFKGWGEDFDNSTLNYGPFGQGGAENWYIGWGHSPAIRAVFDPSVGIDEVLDESTFSIYPNPAKGVATILVDRDAGKYKGSVLDVNGREVWNFSRSSVGRDNKFEFDLTELSAGVYLVRVSSEQGIGTKKLIVQ